MPLQFIANSERDEEKFLDQMRSLRREGKLPHLFFADEDYLVGLVNLAQRDYTRAKNRFKRCVEKHIFVDHENVWAKVILDRLENGKQWPYWDNLQ